MMGVWSGYRKEVGFKVFRKFFLIAIVIMLFSTSFVSTTYSKTIYANVASKINSEPVLLNGVIIKVQDGGCSLRVISETFRSSILELKGRCPGKLNKGDKVMGFFDGKVFVFLTDRSKK